MLGPGATTRTLTEIMPSFKKFQDSWGRRLMNPPHWVLCKQR